MQTGDILITPLRSKGKVIAQAHSWILQDRDELCVMIVWKDGTITSYIEPVPEFEDTDEV